MVAVSVMVAAAAASVVVAVAVVAIVGPVVERSQGATRGWAALPTTARRCGAGSGRCGAAAPAPRAPARPVLSLSILHAQHTNCCAAYVRTIYLHQYVQHTHARIFTLNNIALRYNTSHTDATSYYLQGLGECLGTGRGRLLPGRPTRRGTR